MKQQSGFTLVEVLVASGIMALMAAMSWFGLDALLTSQSRVQERVATSAQWQIALAQWQLDLEQAWQPQGLQPMGWDGQVWRLTRRLPLDVESGLLGSSVVVAWAVRLDGQGHKQWMRWQSPALHSVQDWQQAWQQAANWGRGAAALGSQTLLPAQGMQLFLWASNSWVNAQSSTADQAAASGDSAATASTVPKRSIFRRRQRVAVMPVGVRLVVRSDLGEVTKDWAAPAVKGGQ